MTMIMTLLLIAIAIAAVDRVLATPNRVPPYRLALPVECTDNPNPPSVERIDGGSRSTVEPELDYQVATWSLPDGLYEAQNFGPLGNGYLEIRNGEVARRARTAQSLLRR